MRSLMSGLLRWFAMTAQTLTRWPDKSPAAVNDWSKRTSPLCVLVTRYYRPVPASLSPIHIAATSRRCRACPASKRSRPWDAS